MRKQYYFRPSSRGLLAWDVDRLVQLSGHLPLKRIPLSEIRELDEDLFGDDERPTWRAMLEHVTLIEEADRAARRGDVVPILAEASGLSTLSRSEWIRVCSDEFDGAPAS